MIPRKLIIQAWKPFYNYLIIQILLNMQALVYIYITQWRLKAKLQNCVATQFYTYFNVLTNLRKMMYELILQNHRCKVLGLSGLKLLNQPSPHSKKQHHFWLPNYRAFRFNSIFIFNLDWKYLFLNFPRKKTNGILKYNYFFSFIDIKNLFYCLLEKL